MTLIGTGQGDTGPTFAAGGGRTGRGAAITGARAVGGCAQATRTVTARARIEEETAEDAGGCGHMCVSRATRVTAIAA